MPFMSVQSLFKRPIAAPAISSKYFESAVFAGVPANERPYISKVELTTLSADGTTLFTRIDTGISWVVEVFRDVGGVWTFEANITCPDGAYTTALEDFAYGDTTAMRCSADGNYLIITGSDGGILGGFVYFYNGTSWNLQATLVSDPSITYPLDFAAKNVCISADGATAAIVNRYQVRSHSDWYVNPEFNHSILIFKRVGTTWSFHQHIEPFSASVAPDLEWTTRGATVGTIDLSGDGNVIVLGKKITISSWDLNESRFEVDVYENISNVYTYRDSVQPYTYDSSFGENYISISNTGDAFVVGSYANDSPYATREQSFNFMGFGIVYERSGNSWERTVILEPAGTWYTSSYASSYVISGDGQTIAVGKFDDQNRMLIHASGGGTFEVGSGIVMVFKRQSRTNWKQFQILDTGVDARWYGWAVSVNYDGTRIACSSPDTPNYEATPVSAIVPSFGAVHIWDLFPYTPPERTEVWTMTEDFINNPALDATYWGDPIRISGDGNTLIVGSTGADRIQVYINNAGTWEVQTTLVSPDSPYTITGSQFQISNDGNVIVTASNFVNIITFVRTGATWDAGSLLDLTGKVFATTLPTLSGDGTRLFLQEGNTNSTLVYTRSGNAWVEVGIIPVFSNWTSTSNDGKRVIVQANNSNFVSVYEDTSPLQDGTEWTHTAGINEPVYTSYYSNINFARYQIELSGDGNTIVVADPQTAQRWGYNVFYIFERLGTKWFLRDELTADIPMGAANIGMGDWHTLAVSDDGETVCIGSAYMKGDQMFEGGAVQVYRKVPVSPGYPDIKEWILAQRIYAPYAENEQSGIFGGSLSCNGDGTVIAIGAGGANVADIYGPPLATEVITISSATFVGSQFALFKAANVLPAGSILYTVSINVTLENSVNATYSNDLAFFVGPTYPDVVLADGVFQLGGTNSYAAVQTYWNTGGADVIGTVTSETYAAYTQNVDLSTNAIYYGNGYDDPTTEGTWSGTITIKYLIP